MKILHRSDEMTFNQKTAVTVGKFDGLHMGHETLIEDIVSMKKNDLIPTVVTFDRPPMKMISGESDRLLMTSDEKYLLMEEHGVEILVELPFTDEFMHMSPEDFVKMLKNDLNMAHMIVGNDFTFGYKGAGNTRMLAKFAEQYDFSLNVIEKIKANDRDISSTFVREEIAAGHIENANRMLGYFYYIIGRIIHGNGIGANKIGHATINMMPSEDKLLPHNGVYVTEVILEGRKYHGVTNIGYKPTIEEKEKRIGIETHILDFDRDVYNSTAKVVFRSFIRPERKFASIDDLRHQIDSDIKSTFGYFNHSNPTMPTIYGVDRLFH